MTVCVGDVGRAVSPMTPNGTVEVGGRRLDARSEGLFIAAGSAVVVLRGDPMGCVVRPVEPGQAPPRLPGHGEPIASRGPYRTGAEVDAVERRVQADAARQLRQTLQYGLLAAGTLGVLVGLANGGYGWVSGRAGIAGAADAATFLAGSAGVGAVAAVALFVFTGLVGKVLGWLEGEPEFAPDLIVTFAALLGAAVGYWWRFETGDANTMTLWAVGGALAFAVGAWVIKGVVGNIVGR
jgi:hypothetical protein